MIGYTHHYFNDPIELNVVGCLVDPTFIDVDTATASHREAGVRQDLHLS